MQLDNDLLNLWLSARDGLSCETSRRLIEILQECRNGSGHRGIVKDAVYGQQAWALDLETPTPITNDIEDFLELPRRTLTIVEFQS